MVKKIIMCDSFNYNVLLLRKEKNWKKCNNSAIYCLSFVNSHEKPRYLCLKHMKRDINHPEFYRIRKLTGVK